MRLPHILPASLITALWRQGKVPLEISLVYIVRSPVSQDYIMSPFLNKYTNKPRKMGSHAKGLDFNLQESKGSLSHHPS